MIKAAIVAVLCLLLTQGSFSQEESSEVGVSQLRTANSMPQRELTLDWLDRLFQKSDICPPGGFDALKDFDLDSYISARWHVQKQIPVSYLPVNEFFCTTADYTRDDSFCFLCNKKPRVMIANRARKDSVTGERVGTAPGSDGDKFFRGIVQAPDSDAAKVTVGFGAPFLPKSNYWVVAAGTYDDAMNGVAKPSGTKYEWAIITGGAPKKEGSNGKCLPDPGILNFLGMWMFTRDPVPPQGTVDAIESIAQSMGLDTTAWLTVAQDGCVFDQRS